MKNFNASDITREGARRLIRDNPLAQFVTCKDGTFHCSHLPLIVLENSQGEDMVIGHIAKNNPQLLHIKEGLTALANFTGENAYISPSWLSDRSQAPTWFYSSLSMNLNIKVYETENAKKQAVELLTNKMEAGREHAWNTPELGSRYSRLIEHIVAFEGHISDMNLVKKYGQNENSDNLKEIVPHLRLNGESHLASLVEETNFGRI
ncbi:MAG: FMN-binding negative transcriptional regulator [Alteromonas stellipolaris]|uniref:FMN-binding negative transcriptional regulator n=1 Tax=Alteromonas stellipolaris TaxID=233316 RepID=UPI003B8CBCD3